MGTDHGYNQSDLPNFYSSFYKIFHDWTGFLHTICNFIMKSKPDSSYICGYKPQKETHNEKVIQ